MNAGDLRAQLEEELAWRQDEMRLLRNQLGSISLDADRRRYCKAMVVMLYSHFEGFCKLAFSAYAQAINDEEITCAEANNFIAAASLDQVFRALLDPNRKSDVFRRALPNDAPLHRFARQVEFLDAIDQVHGQQVVIPVDEVVDTDANLKPIILRKILFRLGFPPDTFAAQEGVIHQLLGRRNNIAHGVERAGLDLVEYERLEGVTLEVITRIMAELTRALAEREYLRHAA